MRPTPPITDNPITNSREAPLSKPLVDPRPITAEELRLFQSPENLHGKPCGKQFLLTDSDPPGMYEVIGYSRKRDRTVTYDVLFDDCEDPMMIPVEAEGMMGMLKDSFYFPA
jgi:hypothetical protein